MTQAAAVDLDGLLAELDQRDIRLWREGDALRFDAPEGGFPEELRALVKNHRAELLERLAAAPAELAAPAVPAEPEPIPVRGELEGRLSFAQERLWFLQQLDPEDPSYHIPVALRLDGRLDLKALASAVSTVTARHAILRTVYFADDSGVPHQRVLPAAGRTVPFLDLSGLPESRAEEEAERLAAVTVREPFGLGRTPDPTPPVRWRLLRLSAHRHHLILVLHHLSGDGWSLGLLLQQVARAYAAGREGRERPPTSPAVSYLDFAAWQRERWEQGDLGGDVAFWRRTLEGLSDLELPRREAGAGQPSGRLWLRWPEDMAVRVEALARAEGVTPFAVLVAAWQAVLGRLSGQRDFAVGTPVAGRVRLELEGVVGLLINSLVLRADLSETPGLGALAGRAHRASVAAQEHQELPFERLVASLGADRGSRRSPLFQVLVAQQPPLPPIRLPDLTMTPLPLWSGAAQMDLLLAFARGGEGFQGYLEYRGETVDPTAAARWLRSLRILLTAGLEAPERAWQDLPILAPAERHQLTVEAQADPTRLDPSDSLWGRFAARCQANPEALAVRWEGHGLSYGELQRRALRFAARLRAEEVGRGDRVGLLLDPTPAMVVAILGTVAAGAAYVPLDPAYPQGRLEFLIRDAQPALLVAEVASSGISELPAELREIPLLTMDVHGEMESEAPADLPSAAEVPAGAGDPAYLIYTSGSTGHPKGVAVPHGHVLRLFDAALEDGAFGPDGLGPGDVWSVFHSFSFDFSVWEMWGALLLGGRLVLVPRSTARSPWQLLELLDQEGVTVLSQTPSAFRALQRELEDRPTALSSLAWVVFGGEALDPQALRPWVSRRGFDGPRLINMYGITETTVHVTFHRLGPSDLEAGRSPVGRPLADLSVHLLDSRLKPVAPGTTGEICVGGAGVARGYFGRPALTAGRFVPDPFAGDLGGRLYRSGDLARQRPDGGLEILGRADQQVKVRGHRIEPGEVEAALLALPEISEAVVTATRGEEGESRLVAYYVPAAATEPSASDLLARLAVDLPPFLVPSLLIPLAEIPLTNHGKLDRRALPVPTADRVERARFRPPKTATERLLAEVWGEVLETERVGLDDSFFALGGDSILTLRVQALARRQGLTLDLEDVFRYPTLGEMAAALDRRGDDGAAGAGSGGSPRGSSAPRPFSLLEQDEKESVLGLQGELLEDAFPATRLQQGMLFHGELDPSQGVYHDVFSHHLEGPWSPGALRAAAAELARRHPTLRTAFELAALHRPLALVARRIVPEITFADLRRLDPDAQEAVIQERLETERQRAFVAHRMPLWRLDAVRRGEARWQLTLSFHHAILDGWSVASMSRELVELYLAAVAGDPFPTAPVDDAPQRQARDEVAALADPASGEFWSRYLASAPPSPLNAGAPGDVREAAGAVKEEIGTAEIPVPWEVQAGARLQEAARRLGLPLKSVLLAVHLRLLEAVTGRRRPWTGLIVHTRPGGPAAERSLGLFLNTLPLRSPGPTADWVSRARAVFAAEAELQRHRHYPLAAMRQEAGGEELFDTAFNYVHFHVFQGLEDERLRVLDGQFLERTDLPLLAHFFRAPDGEGLALTLKVDLQRVSLPHAEAIAGLYRRVLGDAAAALGKEGEFAPVAAWLDDARRRRRLAPGRGGPAAAPGICLDALVAAAVTKNPDTAAVVGPSGELSYGELWRWAGVAAQRLQELGVGPEVPVGLYLGRTPTALVAMLGALRCGGIAMPLDPSLPARRLAAMVRDSRAPVVITDRPAEAILGPETVAVPIADFGEAPPPEDTFGSQAGNRAPRHPVYLLYTSGSTGEPKAVTMPHGVLAGLLAWQRECLRGGARTAWFSALGFDVSFQEIFSTWSQGGTLVVVTEEERHDPQALLRRLGASQVECLFLPFVALRELAVAAEGLAPEDLPSSLEDLVSAGEQVHLDGALATLCEGPPARRLHNHYGPTETHVVSAARFTGDPLRWPSRAPVGRPIAGSRLAVLDEHLEPVASGTAGELYIGGEVLARGYHRRPALTAERFVPDPFAADWDTPPGSRLYRTGDRARWLNGRELEVLGRLDDQLKVRGHRVELGEVESTLMDHPAVSAAAAAVHGAGAAARLVAYCVPRPGTAAPSVEELGAWLAERLPAAMVPDVWITLEALPRTASGKLHRRALPAPGALPEGASAASGNVASGLAAVVAATFAEVLELPSVGADDSFFALGGHSLSAARAMARLRRQFDAELPLRLLFEHPTPASLARELSRRRPTAEPRLVRLETAEAPPLSFAQERLWLMQRLDPGSAAYNMPVPLRLGADADLGVWRRALGRLVARHQTLRSLVEETSEGPRAQSLAPGPLPLPVMDLRALPPEARRQEATRLGRRLASTPFDLAVEPPLRTAWLDLGKSGKALVLVFHHAACDGWSLGIVARELSAAVEEGGAELPELEVEYGDYASWQRRREAGGALDGPLAWWLRQLEGLPPVLSLPLDRPRTGTGGEGGWISLDLPAETVAGIEALAREAGTTRFAALLAAYQLLLGRFGGGHQVVVGTPEAGRMLPELELLVGCFVNTLPLRADLRNGGFGDLVRQVGGTVVDALSHAEVPFERLVAELVEDRHREHTPLVQVSFTLDPPGLDAAATGPVELLPMGAMAARFDLELSLSSAVGGGMAGGLAYRTDILDHSTAERLRGSFERLLSAALADPGQGLWELELLSPSERKELTAASVVTEPPEAEWNLARRMSDTWTTRREETALLWSGGSWSYARLGAEVRARVQELLGRGVGPETVVGLDLPRSPELVAWMLAVVFAGGAYLPLAPEHPRRRRAALLSDSGARWVVAPAEAWQGRTPEERAPKERALEGGAPEREDAEGAIPAGVQRLDPEVALSANATEAALFPPARSSEGLSSEALSSETLSSEALAYVLYTSGSTGRPKGVMVSRAALGRYLARASAAYGVGGKWLLHTPVAYDLAITGLWLPLLSGGRVVLAPDPLPASGLGPLVPAGEEAPRVKLTPSQARLLGEALGDSPGRWELVLGGEALSPGDVAWLPAGSRVHDEYGPTEAVVGCTVSSSTVPSSTVSPSTVSGSTVEGPLDGAGPEAVGSGIGRPMPGCTAWVVDEGLGRLPVGVPGEMAVGGRGLARGYLGRPRETAARFVPDPFSGLPGSRLYRTGDRARWRPGSEGGLRLEYLGREDSQLKIRGVRVEPAEVEAALASLPSVRTAVVEGRQSSGGLASLVAWLVPEAGELRDREELVEALREELGRRLPEALVPSQMVVLDRLPTTAVGKVDRRSLPEPEVGLGRPVRRGTEEQVARLWTELLGLAELPGADADFFALGGHSLVASRLVARLRRDHGVEVPLPTVFSASRLETFAAAVDELRGTPPLPPIQRLSRSERQGPIPLSFTQERMWLLHRLDPTSTAYHVPAAIEISGDLDGRRLAVALGALTARQSVLRTRIVEAEAGPVQVIDGEEPVSLPRIDLTALPEALAETLTESSARRLASIPFDLAGSPPWRSALWRLTADRHVLVFAIHHVATDGWSMSILFSDLLAAYGGDVLPPLLLDVADHAAWQRRSLQGEALEARLVRWRERLEGAPRLLEMPTDRPRPARLDDEGARLPAGLPPASTDRLRDLAERRSTTPFVVLLALWQALLGRWTGRFDLPIGVPMTAREAPELEAVVGPFVDTLVLRGDLRGDPSLRELVRRGQRDALDAFSLRDLPFERLVEELEVERSLSHTPLFQVMFAYHDLPPASLDGGVLALRRWHLETGAVQSDLGLVLAPEGEGIEGVLEYRSALFDQSTGERLAAAFQRLAAALLEQPDQPFFRVPLLSARERAAVLTEWSGAESPAETPPSLLATFFQQAQRQPGKPAVVDPESGTTLTYDALAAAVVALAEELRGAGLDGEDRIAVLAHRSPTLVISLLAVLAAGAAFVPLDPGLPRSRRDEILALAGCSHALMGEGEEDDLEVPTTVVRTAARSSLPATPRWPAMHSQTAAYVLFTSGSSGRPKGVVVPVTAFERFLAAARNAYGVAAADRVLQMASPAFDTSLEEIFVTLATGATLVLRGAETMASPQHFVDFCETAGVTVLDLPTAWWHELAVGMGAGTLRLPPSVRLVIIGGEEARAEVLPAWFRGVGPDVRLINSYGPTETTVAVTAAEGFTPRVARIPIGRPYTGSRTLVLDRHLGPVLPGAAGELCIGGGTLARGYLDEPARTAEVFVPDPFSAQPGARLYRTGDRVRFAADGQLEFLGRLDRQIKLRGYRVEPGEVEAALLSCEGVQGAAVAVLEGPAGPALAAWVVTGRPLEELTAALADRVPVYLQPTLWAAVERLETTVTGKIDRGRMAPPKPLKTAALSTAGRTPEEEGLAALWRQVLGVEEVGGGDDFFALGGHSLAAARLIPRIREAFGVEMPLSDLFEAPTLRLQAERLGERMRRPLRPEPPPLEPAADRHLLSFAQERLWFLDRLDPGSPAFGMPSAVRLEGPLDARALRASWSALAERHEALRTSFPEVEGMPRAQLLSAPSPESWPVVDLAAIEDPTAEGEARRLATAERAFRFDLSKALPLRVVLLRHGPERWDLLVNLHHIAADGGSIAILLEELQQLYGDFAAGREPSLPPLALQYGDFAAWERRWLEEAGASSPLLERWKSHLGGELPRIALPYDHPSSGEEAPSRPGGVASLSLSAEALRTLEEAAAEWGGTSFVALLAAFKLYLSALTGQRDQRVGTPVEVRPDRALEGVVGMFTNTVVLRTHLGADPSFEEAVQLVRSTAVSAWSLRELPYGRLLAALRPDRDPGQAPLYEVWFVLQDPAPRLTVPGIQASPLPTGAGPTKFALAANLTPTGEGLRGVLEYDRGLFNRTTAQRLAAGFQAVLEALARDPGQRVSALASQLAREEEAADHAGRRRFEANLKDRLGDLRSRRSRAGAHPSLRKEPQP